MKMNDSARQADGVDTNELLETENLQIMHIGDLYQKF